MGMSKDVPFFGRMIVRPQRAISLTYGSSDKMGTTIA